MKRNIAIIIFLLAGLAVAFVGCDSSEDDRSDAERFVGAWTATQASVNVDSGTPLGTLSVPVLDASDEGEIRIDFDAGGRFVLTVTGPISAEFFGEIVDVVEDGVSETTTGSYSVQSDGQLRFTPTGADAGANVDYDFSGDDAFDLDVDNSDEGRAFIALLIGNDDLANIVEGGSVTFRRDS